MPAKKRFRKRNITNVDWNLVNFRKMEIGELGERIVLTLISQKLRDKGYEDLDKYIDHVSKSKGDGMGYDILTIDNNGDKIFIEVKTTTSSSRLDFILTQNELQFLSQNKTTYFIYRVYNLNQTKMTYDLDIYQGKDVLNYFTLDPQTYKVRSSE